MICDVENIFIYLLTICMSSFEKKYVYLQLLTSFIKISLNRCFMPLVYFSALSLWVFFCCCSYCSFHFWWDWGLNSGLCTAKQELYCLNYTSNPVLFWLFWHWSLWTISSGWPWTMTDLLILACQQARITNMSHWYSASNFSYCDFHLKDFCFTF
jgi:hypothetical protein